jgi:hypothetical protein
VTRHIAIVPTEPADREANRRVRPRAAIPVVPLLMMRRDRGRGRVARVPPDRRRRVGFSPTRSHQPSTRANTSGTTIVASDSMMNLGVSAPSFPQVIFSFGTAPEYDP